MIIEMKPLSMPEAKHLLESIGGNDELAAHVNKFTRLKESEAMKLRVDLEKLEMMKMKPEYLVKIIDLLPEDLSDLNKIFAEVSLDESEAKKILEIVQHYR